MTLTAAAATDSAFTGWTGEGCSGTGTCTVATTQARSVTATFERKAVITSPANGSTLGGSSQPITLISGTGAAQYWLDIGTTPGGMNIYIRSQGLATSGTASGLPAWPSMGTRALSRVADLQGLKANCTAVHRAGGAWE